MNQLILQLVASSCLALPVIGQTIGQTPYRTGNSDRLVGKGRSPQNLSGARQSGEASAVKTQKRVTTGRRAVKTDKAPQAIGPYSQAIVVGELVFTSGQIAIDPKTDEMVGIGIEEQSEQVLLNLSAVLEAAGSSTGQVLKTTVFLADMGDFNAMNEVYRRHFKEDPPARSTVQVARLPRNARIEIEAIALVKRN